MAYLKIQTSNSSYSFLVTNAAPAKPYLKIVSDAATSFLPLITKTSTHAGMKMQVVSGTSSYRNMFQDVTSTSNTYNTSKANTSSMSNITYLTTSRSTSIKSTTKINPLTTTRSTTRGTTTNTSTHTTTKQSNFTTAIYTKVVNNTSRVSFWKVGWTYFTHATFGTGVVMTRGSLPYNFFYTGVNTIAGHNLENNAFKVSLKTTSGKLTFTMQTAVSGQQTGISQERYYTSPNKSTYDTHMAILYEESLLTVYASSMKTLQATSTNKYHPWRSATRSDYSYKIDTANTTIETKNAQYGGHSMVTTKTSAAAAVLYYYYTGTRLLSTYTPVTQTEYSASMVTMVWKVTRETTNSSKPYTTSYTTSPLTTTRTTTRGTTTAYTSLTGSVSTSIGTTTAYSGKMSSSKSGTKWG